MDSGGLVIVLLLCCSGTWAQDAQNAQTECPLSEDHRADVLLLLDGFNNINSEDFSKVRDFLETLVQILGVVGLDSVRIALVKCGGKPETEFYLNTYHDVPSVVRAVKRMSQSPPSPGALTTNDMFSVLETIFQPDRGGRADAPDALILISDRNSPGVNTDTVEHSWRNNIKVWTVGYTDYSELKAIGDGLYRPEVYTITTLNQFQYMLKELTQALCHWIRQIMDLPGPKSLRFSDVQPRRARVSWTYSGSGVEWFSLSIKPDSRILEVRRHERTTEIQHLKPNTSYEIIISAHGSEQGLPATGRLTTQLDSVRLSGGPSRCSGSLEVHTDQMWSSVCAEDFSRAEAEGVCRELDCGGVSDLQGALFTEGAVVGRSFYCNGAETAPSRCKSFEMRCSAAANITCSDDVALWLTGVNCYGFLELRREDQWRKVQTVHRVQDLDFGSALCQKLGCGLALGADFRFARGLYLWLDTECVKQRADLRNCLVPESSMDSYFRTSLFLVCSESLPPLRITVSSEGVSQSLVPRALVRSGANFSVSCSIDQLFQTGFFHLFSPSGNYTQLTVNDSAHFLFSAFGPAHTGDYTCAYSEKESSKILKNVTVFIGPGVPDSHLLLRAGIHVLILLLSTTALYFYCQASRGKRRGQL